MVHEIYKPIGLIEIYDSETHEIVYKTNNMIVIDGRNLIFNRLTDPVNTFKLSDLKLFIEFNQHPDLTTNDTKYSSLNSANLIVFDKDTTSDITESKYQEYFNNANDVDEIAAYNKKFIIINDSDSRTTKLIGMISYDETFSNSAIVGAIGTLYNDSILFSRAVVNSFMLRPNRSYLIKYTFSF